MTNISTISNPILIQLYLLDLSHRDESNGSIFIKFESLIAKLFAISYFYYELSHYNKISRSAQATPYMLGRTLQINKFDILSYKE